MDIPKREWTQRSGVWWLPTSINNRLAAKISCPNGHVVYIDSPFIAPDGAVSSFIKCDQCEFNSSIKLLAW